MKSSRSARRTDEPDFAERGRRSQIRRLFLVPAAGFSGISEGKKATDEKKSKKSPFLLTAFANLNFQKSGFMLLYHRKTGKKQIRRPRCRKKLP
jgi:hypothetical protein